MQFGRIMLAVSIAATIFAAYSCEGDSHGSGGTSTGTDTSTVTDTTLLISWEQTHGPTYDDVWNRHGIYIYDNSWCVTIQSIYYPVAGLDNVIEGTMTINEYNTLDANITLSNFMGLNSSYGSKSGNYDTIYYYNGSQAKTVIIYGGATIPSGLSALDNNLSDLYAAKHQ